MPTTERTRLGVPTLGRIPGRQTARWWLAPLAIYLLSRVVDAILIVLASSDQVERTADSGFVWREAGADPWYLTTLGNWDGQWYGEIATNGYPSDLPRADGEVVPNAWAFYPLYPYLTRLLMMVGHLPFELAATLIATTAGAAAMVLLYRLVLTTGGAFNAATTVTALCFFPAAPVLQAAYADSLSLLLVVVCLTALRARAFPVLLLATVLLSLSRPIVLPLALVIALHAWIRWRRRAEESFPVRDRVWYAVSAGVAAASFGLWPLIVGLATGVPNAYFATQRAWIYDGSEGWPTWIVSIGVPGARALGLFGVLMFLLAAYVVVRRSGRAWGTEVRLWSVVYLLYLVMSTRPTTSIARYALIALVPAWPVVADDAHVPSPRRRRVTLITIMVLGAALQWIWLRWFFVVHHGGQGFP